MSLPSFLPVPDLLLAKKILAIQPHYDDNDIGAGELWRTSKIWVPK